MIVVAESLSLAQNHVSAWHKYAAPFNSDEVAFFNASLGRIS